MHLSQGHYSTSIPHTNCHFTNSITIKTLYLSLLSPFDLTLVQLQNGHVFCLASVVTLVTVLLIESYYEIFSCGRTQAPFEDFIRHQFSLLFLNQTVAGLPAPDNREDSFYSNVIKVAFSSQIQHTKHRLLVYPVLQQCLRTIYNMTWQMFTDITVGNNKTAGEGGMVI